MDSSALASHSDAQRARTARLHPFSRHPRLFAALVTLGLTPSERNVLLVLLMCADQFGRSWYSPRRLACEIGRREGRVYCAKTISRALDRLHRLELVGWLRVLPCARNRAPDARQRFPLAGQDPTEVPAGPTTECGGRVYTVNLERLRELAREGRPEAVAQRMRPRKAPAKPGGGRDINVPGGRDINVPPSDPSRLPTGDSKSLPLGDSPDLPDEAPAGVAPAALHEAAPAAPTESHIRGTDEQRWPSPAGRSGTRLEFAPPAGGAAPAAPNVASETPTRALPRAGTLRLVPLLPRDAPSTASREGEHGGREEQPPRHAAPADDEVLVDIERLKRDLRESWWMREGPR